MNENQKTVLNQIKFSGVGLHTGVFSRLVLKPAPSNTGIIFIRKDLDNPVQIKAIIDNVINCNRGTTIGYKNISVHTVEHLLSSLFGLRIDNVLIEIDNIEVPILDGSSQTFVDKILKVGIVDLKQKKEYIKINESIEHVNGDSIIKVSPSNIYSATYNANYGYGNMNNRKFTLHSISEYKKEICSARTFCSIDELEYLKENNLIKGVNVNSGIVFINEGNTQSDIDKINKDFNVELKFDSDTKSNVKLRFSDEPVRHKILDLIGDFALLGKTILGHIDSFKGGHLSNIEIMKIIKSKYCDNIKEMKFNKEEIKEIIPHRDPFLLIDEIIGGIPGKTAVAIKNVTKDDYFFKGHFPEKPIMPGVLILECMAQTSCFLSFNNVKEKNDKMMLLSMIKSSKFIKKVLPGDQLIINVRLLKYRLGTAHIIGEARVNEELVSKAEFMATVVGKND